MTIELSPMLARFVETKLSSGQFTTPQEVIHEALEMLQEREDWYTHRINRLREDLDAGLNSGEPLQWNAETYTQRLKANHQDR